MIQKLAIGLADPKNLPRLVRTDDAVVVVDLFRATSTIQILVDKDCEVIPLASLEENYSTSKCNADRIRIGEWQGKQPPGFFADNSPSKVLVANISGKAIEFLSSNGSGAILAAQSASLVICACLFNAGAVIEAILKVGGQWWFCPAGCRGEQRIEDDYVCACLAYSLLGYGAVLQPDIQQLVADLAEIDPSTLRNNPGAQFLLQIGAMQDLDFILHSDYQSSLVPVLNGGKLSGMTVERIHRANV